MSERDAILAAHVRYEVARWSGERLRDSLAEEIGALFEWFADTSLDDVIDADAVADWVDEYVGGTPVTAQAEEMIAEGVRSIHASALADDTAVEDLVPREVFDGYAGTIIGMHEARRSVIEQITTSEVYSKLIAHVLYQGIKNYLLSESPIARRVPGASSLVRLGQSAISSAAPDFGKSIDRQLTAFVNANIQDSIRDSRKYLDTVVDDEVLWSVADEVWAANSGTTVAQVAELVSDESLDRWVGAGVAAWEHVRGTPLVRDLTVQLTADVLERRGSQSVAAVLADAGVTPERVASQLAEAVAPAVDRAVSDGYLEERVQARLAPFYDEYYAD